MITICASILKSGPYEPKGQGGGAAAPLVFSEFHPFYPQNRDLQGPFQGFAPPPLFLFLYFFTKTMWEKCLLN